MIQRLTPFLFFFIIAVACNSEKNRKINESKSQAAPDSTQIKLEVAPIKSEFPRLTNANYAKILKQYWADNTERTIRISTSFGNIDLRLYEETPVHSASFLMLVKRDYFNETMITRVVPQFVIQGGTTDLEETEMKRMVIGNYQMKPEINEQLIHKRGTISAARNYVDNPEKLSAPYNFFIVVGRTFKHPELVILGRNHDKEFPDWALKTYQETGGAPHLDGEHTVFGEVISGMNVVDKISLVEADSREWPLKDIIVNMEVLE